MNRVSFGKFILRIALIAAALASLSACTSFNKVHQAINAYADAAPQIQLGQDKAAVLATLEPTQQTLAMSQRKPPEQFTKDGKLTEIYFYRTSSVADGLVTDDEFTPYIFEDGKLVGIGWTLIGGPKTQSQIRDEPADVRFYGRFWL